MTVIVDRTANVAAALIAAGGIAGLMTGHRGLGIAGVALGLLLLLYALRNVRLRPWGAPLPAGSGGGRRVSFEPTCLVPGCGGPVVELVNGEWPVIVCSISGPAYDPDAAGFYSQGRCGCYRCGYLYTCSVSQGSLSLRSDDGGLQVQNVPPLERP